MRYIDHSRRVPQWTHILAVLLAPLCMVACASTATGSPQGPRGGAKNSADTAEVCSKSEYKIGPGDELNVFVYDQKDLSGEVPVRPDGFISMPLVDRIPAAGLTPTELAHAIEDKLSEYVRTPKVNVIVTHFVGTLEEQIQIVGQGVAKPVALPYKRGTRLLDVMTQAGALTPYAALNRARILRRDADGKQRDIRVRLGDLLNKGDPKQNRSMCPGDVIVIPESMF